MDTTEAISGKRERAPVEGSMGSGIPSQSLGEKRLAGDPHLAFVADKGVAKEHPQWWHSEIKGKVNAQSRQDPAAPLVLDGGGFVLSKSVARGRDRVLGQELTEEEGRSHADLMDKAKERELDARKEFRV